MANLFYKLNRLLKNNMYCLDVTIFFLIYKRVRHLHLTIY